MAPRRSFKRLPSWWRLQYRLLQGQEEASGKERIKPVVDKTTPVLIINGCPNGIKDNIAPIKAVRFFISELTSNQYTNCRENRLYTISLKR